ncbi:hypothetical protein [Evansella cellulosilytica]|uniref:Uncharacterized protein n=1 Tax=Evansella cellulosilytica (strain ATCC 21833 / DSM 2522 / FERM P-1141 / JCM 9156 / N-4) TaxID=649639 RepID=E6TVF4_EVAC2|nr:hypothetical protein [Evansella cellulosilytica]ADU30971.1 hypothetical protein Bcell_2716 [Evansella cellulosilytica DSM 2522]
MENTGNLDTLMKLLITAERTDFTEKEIEIAKEYFKQGFLLGRADGKIYAE